MMSPLFSIIIKDNSSFFITYTFFLLLFQTLYNEKVISFNDISVDNTLEIAQGFSVLDGCITIFSHKKNKHPPITQNTYLDATKEKYVHFFYSDNFLFPIFLFFFWKLFLEHEGSPLFLFSYKARKRGKHSNFYLSSFFDERKKAFSLRDSHSLKKKCALIVLSIKNIVKVRVK